MMIQCKFRRRHYHTCCQRFAKFGYIDSEPRKLAVAKASNLAMTRLTVACLAFDSKETDYRDSNIGCKDYIQCKNLNRKCRYYKYYRHSHRRVQNTLNLRTILNMQMRRRCRRCRKFLHKLHRHRHKIPHHSFRNRRRTQIHRTLIPETIPPDMEEYPPIIPPYIDEPIIEPPPYIEE
jgi:hypothetical protein